MNGHGRRFIEAGYPLGVDIDPEGRGVAIADLDQDGRQDILLRAVARRKLTYFHNDVAGGHFLRVELIGTRSNRDGVGAVVRVKAAGMTQMRTRTAGSGFQGQSEATLHFGLGEATTADSVRVEWPSGLVEQFEAMPADHIVQIVEGRGAPLLRRPAGWNRELQQQGAKNTPTWSAWDRQGMVWKAPAGKPLLLSLWASWCEACRSEVPGLNSLYRKMQGEIGLAGLAVGEMGTAEAEDFVARTKPEYSVVYSDRNAIGGLLDRMFPEGDVPLPAAILFDGSGRPRRVFRGLVNEELVEREVKALLRAN